MSLLNSIPTPSPSNTEVAWSGREERIRSENLREKKFNTQPDSAESRAAAETIAKQSTKSMKNEDDKSKTDNTRMKPEQDPNNTNNSKNIEQVEKNKMIKSKLMSKIKENKKKKQAADKTDKNLKEIARNSLITEYMKPKPEPTGIPTTNYENLVPGAARAGSLNCNLGPVDNFSGEKKKAGKNDTTSQPASGGLARAVLDWPDGDRGPGLSQSE